MEKFDISSNCKKDYGDDSWFNFIKIFSYVLILSMFLD